MQIKTTNFSKLLKKYALTQMVTLISLVSFIVCMAISPASVTFDVFNYLNTGAIFALFVIALVRFFNQSTTSLYEVVDHDRSQVRHFQFLVAIFFLAALQVEAMPLLISHNYEYWMGACLGLHAMLAAFLLASVIALCGFFLMVGFALECGRKSVEQGAQVGVVFRA